MKEQISQSELALDAMRRASREAVARAAEKNLKMPMWKNGEITFVDGKEELLTIESTATPNRASNRNYFEASIIARLGARYSITLCAI